MTIVNQEILNENKSYVPAHLAIEAMRDNGYKNPAYAVAELIDNSIQAGANNIELLCLEKETIHTTRKTLNLEEIAILDNGQGMSPEVLQMALQFGNGTRLGRSDRTGMGRFGMGLPASSISQCKRVEVWTWTNGIENAYSVHLDIDEIKSGKSITMPTPERKTLPKIWIERGKSFGRSGTIVVWSKLDRVIWRRGKTIIDNSEKVIGRMYRKFLNNNSVNIRMAAFDIDAISSQDYIVDKNALPNDPMYLMEKTSCPAPFENEAMFVPYPNKENYEMKHIIDYHGESHEVVVRFSYASKKARSTNNAGSTPHGKHAQSNEGISIIRAGRELDIDKSLLISHDTTERWWGVEIEFPPALDEVMGVSNNKQTARNLAMALQSTKDIDEVLSKSNKTYAAHIEELEDNDDPSAPLLTICMKIDSQLKHIREAIKIQTKGLRSGGSDRHPKDDANSPEGKATEYTDERIQKGNKGKSDEGESMPLNERQQEIKESLVEYGFDSDEAENLAILIAESKLKYHFESSNFDGGAFFTVKPAGGKILINLNMAHPAYSNLLEVLDHNDENETDIQKLQERLVRTKIGLKLLLMAWARYEDELPDSRRDDVADSRQDWGRIARKFLSNNV